MTTENQAQPLISETPDSSSFSGAVTGQGGKTLEDKRGVIANPIPTQKALHVISLGAGVQSSTMALMAARGEITPMPECAIFADTQDEPKAVYDHLDWLEKELPFKVHRVSQGDLMSETLKIVRSKKSRKLYMKGKIPAFVLKLDGGIGLLGRKCTSDFKIEPIHRKTRELIGRRLYLNWRKKYRSELKEIATAKKAKRSRPEQAWAAMQGDVLVNMWIGISDDEWWRAKPSRQPWLRNTWPLLAKRITRSGCEEWLATNGYPIAPRSACRKCPFHSDEEWGLQTPEDFAESVQYERDLQAAARSQEALEGIPFLHESCVPLDEVDFSKRKSKGMAQLDMFGSECSGMCRV